MILDYISTSPSNTLELQLIPKPRQQLSKIQFKLEEVAVKGVSSKGVKMTPRPVKKIISLN